MAIDPSGGLQTGTSLLADPRLVETLLIVDDDALNRMALAELLAADFRILLARDGIGALAMLGREPVSLVLLDVSMPRMDGYEVLRRMKADPQLADIPVIFITGKSEETDEELGLTLGAADYVQKPFRPAVVRARIRTHMSLRRQRAELERLASRDGLTGLTNRRAFDAALDRALEEGARSGTRLALALFDVDYFKQFNDLYGHFSGDDALIRVAGALASAAGPDALAARYGGEEFALLITGGDAVPARMDGVRRAVEQLAIRHEGAPTSGLLTLSGGGVLRSTNGLAARELFEVADALLYRAKAEGRNRVLVDGAE